VAKNLKVAGAGAGADSGAVAGAGAAGAGAGAAAGAAALPVAHSVPEIERQLASLWAGAEAARAEVALAEKPAQAAVRATAVLAEDEPSGAGERHVVARSSVLNLIVVAGHRETAERCAATIAATAGRHPSRSLILTTVDPDGPRGLEAQIDALAVATSAGRAETGAETVHVTARGETGRHLASIIVPLLVHDLPVALWWPHDPQLGGHRADRLLPIADRLIVDGSSWSGNGLDRLAALARLAADSRIVVVDFSLLRQARWREALASVYDLPDLRPHLRAVRSIDVEYAAAEPGDPRGLTNVVRPVYHVAWLASRLGMSVVSPLQLGEDGRRVATLRQRRHAVAVSLRPAASNLGPGSTVRVEIRSQLRGSEMVGQVIAGDRTVKVTIRDQGRARVKRTYLAPRLTDVDLLIRAVEEGGADPLAIQALEMASALIAVRPAREAPHRGTSKRGSGTDE
jgi:glucose-6-phosphate dehydrogenase assembly protein OpcA